MSTEFSSVHGNLGTAVLLASINKSLSMVERREMDRLRIRLGLGSFSPLIHSFVPGKLQLIQSFSGGYYYYDAEISSDAIIVTSDECWGLEKQLYMIYYVRSLPLSSFLEDYKYEQEMAEKGEVGGLEAYGESAALIEAASKLVFEDSESGEEFEDALEEVSDHGDVVGIATYSGGFDDEFAVELGSHVSTGVNSVEVIDGKVFEIIRLESLGLRVNEDVNTGGIDIKKSARPVVLPDEPWNFSAVDTVCAGERGYEVQSLDGEVFLKPRRDVGFYDIFRKGSDDVLVDSREYASALFAVNSSDVSREMKRLILLGESFVSLVYVIFKVQQGWSVESIALGKSKDLSSRSIDDAMRRWMDAGGREYSHLSGSKKNKFRWIVGSTLMQSESAAMKFIRDVFPSWWYHGVIEKDWQQFYEPFSDTFVRGQNSWSSYLSRGKDDLWFLGSMAEFGDAILTYWLYKNMVRVVNVTPMNMQDARANYLSNRYLASKIVGWNISEDANHSAADRMEALAAVLFLRNGYGGLNVLMQEVVGDVSRIYSVH